MEENTRERFISSDIWVRALYMVLFAIAFGLARVVVVFLVLFQFVTVLFTGRANEPLLQFGKNLSVFVFEILEFQTFNTEERPFPFSPWPDEEPGGEEGVDGSFFDSSDDDETPEAEEVVEVVEEVKNEEGSETDETAGDTDAEKDNAGTKKK